MNKSLRDFKIAILVADGFEESEMVEPKKAFEKAGAEAKIISPSKDKVRSWKFGEWSNKYDVDINLKEANANDYDALHLPGGVINPDKLRLIPEAIEFIKKFVQANKPISAICHGPWTLINAGGVKGKTVTSWPSLQIDLINAGAIWVDKEVVRDSNLITSRKPDDIPEFNKAAIELFSSKKV